MYKCIALLKAKAGLSRAELIDYYESRHAPLIRSLLPEIREYRRNFVDRAVASIGAAPDFDVVTELWFDDRAGYESFVARCAEPDVARQIAEDEENVFDRTVTQLFVVDEQGAPSMPAQLRDMAAELQVMRDEREIYRQLGRYCALLDARNIEAFDSIFTSDVQFNYGKGGEQHGLAALKAWMNGVLVCGGMQHMLGQVVIDVVGDAAQSRTYVQARAQGVDDLGGPVFDTNGEYVDAWRRLPEGWRIVRRSALWPVIQGDPGVFRIAHVHLD